MAKLEWSNPDPFAILSSVEYDADQGGIWFYLDDFQFRLDVNIARDIARFILQTTDATKYVPDA